MRKSFWIIGALSLVSLVAAACGGSTEDAGSYGAGSGGSAGSAAGASGTGGGSGGTGGASGTGGSGGTGGTAGGATGGAAGAGASGGVAGAGASGGAAGVGATGGAAGAGATGGAGSGGAAGVAGAGGGGGAGVSCGGAVCTGGDSCLICDPTGTQSPKKCVAGFNDTCPTFPNLRMFCDDHGDCTSGEKCTIIEGSVGTYGQCTQAAACIQNCTCGGGPGSFSQVCSDLSDCPACATSCEPYQQFGQGGAFPVKVCVW